MPMTATEFERLPRDPGWKYEYVNGVARITPRHVVVTMRAPVMPRIVEVGGLTIRAMTEADRPGLVRAFHDGFRETVEYCDWSDAQIRQSGEDAIRTFFGGRRGAFHPASRLAVAPEQPDVVAGASLVVQKADLPFLDMLFIRPRWHRRGLATALVGASMNALHAQGEPDMGSAYDLANLPSRAWHEQFGFVEQPDYTLAHARAAAARHELWRRREIGGLSDAEQAALQAEAEHWERLADALAERLFNRRAAARSLRQSSPA